MSDVTRILSQIGQGDPSSAEQLLPLVYDELRKLANAKMALERPDQTLQATALVSEAYLRLVDVDRPQDWNGRGHFFAAAAEAMRRILIENARRRRSEKHGGKLQRHDIVIDQLLTPELTEDLLALDDALCALAEKNPQAAELVKLRFFAGLSVDDAAVTLGISPRKANYVWLYARSWLRRRISQS